MVVNKKKINSYLDLIVKDSLNKGNLHYGITINFNEELKYPEDIIRINLKINLVIEEFKNTIKLVDYLYVSLELGENNRPHIHILVAIKSFIGYNSILIDNINKYFRKNIALDFKIDLLLHFIDVKKFFSYILKDIEKNYSNHWLEINKPTIDCFGDLIDYLNSESIVINISFFIVQYSNVTPPKITQFKEGVNTIFHMINYYMILNNYYIFNNSIYEKIENSLISYKKINEIEDFVKNLDNIFMYFYSNFYYHFHDYDLYNLKLDNLDKIEEKLKNLNKITTNKINPTFDILEFTDGLYFIKHNLFFKKKELIGLNLNQLQTIKYYNKSYHNLSKPKLWLKNISHALNNNEESVNLLKAYFANIFHDNLDYFYKKKVLYVYGKSNTKKTTLIAKFLIGYFEKENIGFITNSKNYKFQELIGKKLAIFDEFRYSKSDKEQLLKLFSGEILKIDIKFEKAQEINSIPVIIISNELIKEENLESQQAFLNRINLIEFVNAIENEQINSNIISDLKNEESNIVVYCNKYYFKNFKKKINKKKLLNSLKFLE